MKLKDAMPIYQRYRQQLVDQTRSLVKQRDAAKAKFEATNDQTWSDEAATLQLSIEKTQEEFNKNQEVLDGLTEQWCLAANAENAKALADALQKQGFKILTGGTDNHLMLVDLRGMDVSGKELQNRCDEVYITLNKNTVPNDPRSPFVTSGVRIGTPAITSRGLVESDMDEIARCVWLAATDFENKADEIRASVTEICGRYPIYQ